MEMSQPSETKKRNYEAVELAAKTTRLLMGLSAATLVLTVSLMRFPFGARWALALLPLAWAGYFGVLVLGSMTLYKLLRPSDETAAPSPPSPDDAAQTSKQSPDKSEERTFGMLRWQTCLFLFATLLLVLSAASPNITLMVGGAEQGPQRSSDECLTCPKLDARVDSILKEVRGELKDKFATLLLGMVKDMLIRDFGLKPELAGHLKTQLDVNNEFNNELKLSLERIENRQTQIINNSQTRITNVSQTRYNVSVTKPKGRRRKCKCPCRSSV
jgi:hypothetical protein